MFLGLILKCVISFVKITICNLQGEMETSELKELTPIIINMWLTHLYSEASK